MEKQARDLTPGDEILGITADLDFDVVAKVLSVEHGTVVARHNDEDDDLDKPFREVPVATIRLYDTKRDEEHIWKTNANKFVKIKEPTDA